MIRQISENILAIGSTVWTLVLISAFFLAAYLFSKEWRREALVVEPFDVPESLTKLGLTGSALSLRLSDEIVQLQREARLDDDPADIVFTELPRFQVDLQLPGVAWSVRGAIRYLRQALGRVEPKIIGEVVMQRTFFAIRLRSHGWRHANVDVHFTDGSNLDAALKESAEVAIRLINPLEAASIFYVRESRRDGYPKTLAAIREHLSTAEADTHGDAYVLWATVHRALGDTEAMTTKLELARAAGHLGTRYFNFVGGLHRERREYQKAEAAYQEALRINPSYIVAINNLGVLFADQWRLEDAERMFRRAIRLRPKSSRGYRGLGLVAMRRGDPAQALIHLQRAIDVVPQARWPRVNKIGALRQLGLFDRAEEEIVAFREIEADFSPYLRIASDVRRDQGRFDDALALNDLAIRSDPNDPWVYQQRSDLLRRLRRFSEAEDAARRVLVVRPDMAEAFMMLSSCAADQGRPDEALRLAERALVHGASEPSVVVNAANELRRQGRFDAAHRVLMGVPGHVSDHPDVERAWAKLAEDRGNLPYALERLDAVIARTPHDPWPRLQAGSIERRLGNHAAARARIDAVIERWPFLHDALKHRCWLLRDLESYDEAIEAIGLAERLAPHDPDCHVILAELHRRKGDFAAARASLVRAFAFRPTTPGMLAAAAEIARSKGRRVLAVRWFGKAAALAPFEPYYPTAAADQLHQMGRTAHARPLLERALSLRPMYSYAIRVEGNIRRAEKKPDEALRLYRQAVVADPFEPWNHIALGRELFDQGQQDDAIACAEMALRYRPRQREAKDLLERAEARRDA